MFGSSARLSSRPRVVRPGLRASLRLESLEARANPSAPALTNVKADWGTPGVVVVTGTVLDESPESAGVQIGGAAQGDVKLSSTGEFYVALKTTSAGSLYLRALDGEALFSSTMGIGYGESCTVSTTGSSGSLSESTGPSLGDVRLEQGPDGWHIRGHLDGSSPLGGIIKIVSGSGSGQSGEVDVDGNFDILIKTDGSGPISIIGVAGDGTETDTWDGYLG